MAVDSVASNVVLDDKRFVMDLEEALARDASRARAVLRDIFGEIRLVEGGEELYAKFESPLQRLTLSREQVQKEWHQYRGRHRNCDCGGTHRDACDGTLDLAFTGGLRGADAVRHGSEG
jgi:hypothetical protein